MIYFAIFLIGLSILLSINLFFAIKYAPFVATPWPTVERILKEAKIKPGQILFDLGCGDGRFIHLATKKYQAKATGFEIDPSRIFHVR